MFSYRFVALSALLATAGTLFVGLWWTYSSVQIGYDDTVYLDPNAPSRVCLERMRQKMSLGLDAQGFLMLTPVTTNTSVFGGPLVKDPTFWGSATQLVRTIWSTMPIGSLIGSNFFAKSDPFSAPRTVYSAEVDLCEKTPPPLRKGPLKMCYDLLYGWQNTVSDAQDATVAQIIPNLQQGTPQMRRWTDQLRNDILPQSVKAGQVHRLDFYSIPALTLDVSNGLYEDLQIYIPIVVTGIAVLFGLAFQSVGPIITIATDVIMALVAVAALKSWLYDSIPWVLPAILFLPIMVIVLINDAVLFGSLCKTSASKESAADVLFSLRRFSLCSNLTKAAAFSGMAFCSSVVLQMIYSGVALGLAVQFVLLRGLVTPSVLAAPRVLHRTWGESKL